MNTHAVDILQSGELTSRLSAAEVEYARGYFKLVTDHVRATVTDRLKPGEDECHVLTEKDVTTLLPLQHDGVVFCRVEADAGTVDLGVGVG